MSAVVDQEFRASLRETARGFLARSVPPGVLRAAVEQGEAPAAEEIVSLGWFGVEVPEKLGGLGAGFGELAILLEETGRCLLPFDLFATAVLGVGGLRHGSAEQRGEWLPALAAGERAATAALTGPDGVPGQLGVEATPAPGGWSLSGSCGFVSALAGLGPQDAILVAARAGATGTAEVFLVRAGAAGVSREPQPTYDRSRRLGRLGLDRVAVGESDRIGEPGSGPAIVAELGDRAALALAADCVGGAGRALELTVEHLSTRHQFGRPIGSFQALKHRCADMLLALEGSRGACAHAADLELAAGAGGDAVSVAKSYAGDAYVHVAAEAVQLHGGIGYTWEHDLHMHLKRARLNQALAGDSAWHRERLAAAALAGV